MNLIAPDVVGPAEAFDAVAALAPIAGAELVGAAAGARAAGGAADRGRAELDLERGSDGRRRAWRTARTAW